MITKDILKVIESVQFDDIRHWEDLPLEDKDYKMLEEVGTEATNPRRDYIGTKYFLKNNDDGKYFFIEVYGNEMAFEVYAFGEVVPVEKTITTYKEIE